MSVQRDFDAYEYAGHSSKVAAALTVADGLHAIARALVRLGNADAATPMGGLEALGKVHKDASDVVSDSINRLAEAVENQ